MALSLGTQEMSNCGQASSEEMPAKFHKKISFVVYRRFCYEYKHMQLLSRLSWVHQHKTLTRGLMFIGPIQFATLSEEQWRDQRWSGWDRLPSSAQGSSVHELFLLYRGLEWGSLGAGVGSLSVISLFWNQWLTGL